MAYIIEKANILKSKQLKTQSLLVDKDKVSAIITRPKQYRMIRMNLEPFIMTPSFVLLNSNISPHESFQVLKQTIIEQFILKGCTTLFTYVTVSFENELLDKVNEMKLALMNSPIDYIIAVKIPLSLVTPSFIRKCKQEKIPAFFIEVDDYSKLTKVPWGWIREALFPYNCPFIPIISSAKKKEARALLSNWNNIMIKEKIPALYQEIPENRPISTVVLNKIGFYPQRSSLMNGTELSYNLYMKTREIKNVDEEELFFYHGDRLVITVHKGKIVRCLKDVRYKPGYGEHIMMRTPAFFSL